MKQIVILTTCLLISPFFLRGQSINRYAIAYDYICEETNNDSIYVPMMLLDDSYFVITIEDFIDYFEINDSAITQLRDMPENKVSSTIHEYHAFFVDFVREKIDYDFSRALFFSNISNNILFAEYFPRIEQHYPNKHKFYEEFLLTRLFFSYYAYLFHFNDEGQLINVYKMLVHSF
ncbi:MAG: hypothetical protein J6X70_07355 [Muribaculaceae bacterium]|nr:hypothetical protein [Muribaculaceae bacterium]